MFGARWNSESLAFNVRFCFRWAISHTYAYNWMGLTIFLRISNVNSISISLFAIYPLAHNRRVARRWFIWCQLQKLIWLTECCIQWPVQFRIRFTSHNEIFHLLAANMHSHPKFTIHLYGILGVTFFIICQTPANGDCSREFCDNCTQFISKNAPLFCLAPHIYGSGMISFRVFIL